MREKKALESKAKGPDANPAEVEPRQVISWQGEAAF